MNSNYNLNNKIAILGIRGLPANYGGFETCAEHTSNHWISEGYEVLAYCRKDRYENQIKEYNGVKLKYITSINSKNLDTLSNTLFSVLHLVFVAWDYKIVHLYNSGNAIFIPLLKMFGKKVLISVDGIEWKRDKWGKLAKMMYKLGEWCAVQFADYVIVDNQEIKNYYKKKYNADTTLIAYGAKIITNDVTFAEKYLKKYNLTPRKYFLFVGRFVPEKGIHNLISAYLKLNTGCPLVIIGDDNNHEEYKKSLLAHKSEKIKFLGFVYNEEYEQLLCNSYMYVSASSLEGTSPSLLSAMGAGVCALVNGIEENHYTVEDCAFTFAKNDFEDLAITWQRIIDSPKSVKEMADKGYNHVMNNYRWDVISRKYTDLF